ncbi:hypothetical protein CIW83_09360 [Tissierella sp. P1]|uniref:hypothetical protein n=1 Tax=Tissierella sp. P1 TaxID=1280483 RepID=UPI000B9FD92C|nr:hypothetical protein [Tissierella sp. P1]OZV12296.1 hypothetical protein CIW83_09360 [Tissierella sp. P1]
MKRCEHCINCKIIIDELTNAEARCMATKSKKGRCITWACTVYKTREDAMWRVNGTAGESRVKESLSK